MEPVRERITIEGRGRLLEGVLAYPSTGFPAFGVLLAGPHPFLGGSLQNNIVTALLDAVPREGGLALAFNYAGVGASEGGPPDWPSAMSQFWQHGRIDYEKDWAKDAVSAWSTLSGLIQAPRALVGYSFGCWTASRCIAHGDADAVVAISPNARRHDLSLFHESAAALFVLCSDNDFTCELSEVRRWFDGLREPKTFDVMEAGEHFFRGHEREVVAKVLEYLNGAGVLGDCNESR